MNYSDAARIKAVLTHCWRTHTTDRNDADVIIFDTCSVRQKSEDKVTGKLKEVPPHKKVWMTWCMIQHNMRNAKIMNETQNKKIGGNLREWNFVGTVLSQEPIVIGITNDEIQKLDKIANHAGNIVYVNHAYNPLFFKLNKQFPNIELFFRIDDTGFLPLMMNRLGYNVSYDSELTNEYTSIIPHDTNQLINENTKTAYVPISTWCSQFCAYCIVPYARWLEKNRPVDDIIKEVRYHLDRGIEEIVLLGQIVNKHPQFVEICKQILALPWLTWLRYTSPYPTFFPEELLDLHAHEEKMAPHIHMPLQSWSNTILKKMFRWYTAEQYKIFVDNIRKLPRKISLTTDIIIWFCDETEEDFQQSMDMIEYAKFDMIYMGIYSPRPWTYGAKKYQDNVPREIKKDRRHRMNELLKQISLNNNQADIGTNRLVMINKIDHDRVAWYTDTMKNVIIKGNYTEQIDLWQFINVTITDAECLKLFGTIQSTQYQMR